MSLQLTEEETQLILERRERIIRAESYNEGLRDAYGLVSTMPMSETRNEVMGAIKTLWREVK